MLLFADDCVMYLTGNNWNEINRRMQCDFDAVIDWTLKNNLRLNHAKTFAMIFSTCNRLARIEEPRPFIIGNNVVRFVKIQMYLGITLDVTMCSVYRYSVSVRSVDPCFGFLSC